jgi:hypothetical protein
MSCISKAPRVSLYANITAGGDGNVACGKQQKTMLKCMCGMCAARTCSALLMEGTAGAPLPPGTDGLTAAVPLAADPPRPAAAAATVPTGGVLAAAPAHGTVAVSPSISASSLLVSAMAAGAPGGTVNGLPCSCCNLQRAAVQGTHNKTQPMQGTQSYCCCCAVGKCMLKVRACGRHHAKQERALTLRKTG